MILTYQSLIKFLFIVLSIISVQQWVIIPITTTSLSWIIYLIFSLFLVAAAKNFNKTNSNFNDYKYLKWFLFWVLICFIRGIFIADNYWDYKSLITNSFALILGLAVYAFTKPELISIVLRSWWKYAPFIFLLLMPFLETTAYGYLLVPLSFLALFFPSLPKRTKIFVLIGTLLVVVSDLDARSNVIKFTLPFIFSFLYYFPNLLHSNFYRRATIIIAFSIPFVFLGLAINGTFNIFKMDEYLSGEYTQKKVVDGETLLINLKADTRTFLYEEVILSAIKNNYFLFGRSPARGNESFSFGGHAAEELGTGRYERYSNEVSILNVFTWTGLLGVFLYLLIFLKATYLALFKSNNRYMIIIGSYVAFRWMYAWVEDFNRFDIMNLMLWIGIAMCYSRTFRSMNNMEFKNWVYNIFNLRSRSHIITNPK